MMQKPEYFTTPHAEAFQAQSVAKSYRLRPTYPDETFTILAGLQRGESRRVLDVGSGTGNVARRLIERVERVDAVDFSQAMIEEGKRLPNGQHPHLNWLYGRIEEIALDPPYALVTAGASLHWMDWNVVLPRFRELLVPDGYLAIVGVDTRPDPWSSLNDVLKSYRTDAKDYKYDMLEELERHGLFRKAGERRTAPIPLVQTLDDYIESYHSRSGFSRERMGQARADEFDREAKKLLLQSYPDGEIPLQVTGDVVWGYPAPDPAE
jgi:ubiquinone/menaquinone biosynthesis C-methylase UbiE